ncbi:amidohydrolase family protein [Parasphingorhabdus flavimaris]|uniref:Amidohydrolase family protein n=1 Tax=Parasphingorhabdus flavimaris TaxID=266812 RepID=A0ABX2MZA7_9SPHN|nr:amidohydrolase family protein [Parasphingorhabdus flavimaris]NVD26691.1 amidohydrolase family protein [Parasphingorhabdus flavimaris]
MLKFISSIGAALTLLIATGAQAEEGPATLPYPEVTIFKAAKIITMEPGFPEARYVATADGIILGLGQTLEELEAWTRDRTVTVDRQFSRQILMPGFVEPHVHPMQTIMMLPIPFISPEPWDLPGKTYPAARGKAQYEQRLREEMAKSEDALFITWGHHKLFHGDMDRAALDRIAPDRPVVIWQRSFHEIIANSKALTLLGIGEEAAFTAAFSKPNIDPGHADYASGIIHETALFNGIEMLRPYLFSPAKVQQGLADMRQMMLENGVTTSADLAFGGFGGPEMESALFKSLYDQPTTPSRILAIPVAPLVTGDPNVWLKDMKAKYDSPKFFFSNRIKLFADGAFFAQYMQMNPPGYSDGHEGKWLTEPEELLKQTERFWDAGWNLHTHVNGDKGLDVVLDITQQLAVRNGQNIIIEHLGYSTEAQNRRIGEMGLYVSAQPNYIRILGDAYAKTGMGPDRAAQMSRLGSLERKGVPLGLHSDFNMAPIDPLYLAWVASNRITLDGNVKAPKERLSLDKALRAITIEAAQVIGLDDMVGSIATGKKADFTVLDRDPYVGGAAKLREVEVRGVVFEGIWFPAE